MLKFDKPAYNEEFRTMQFRRPDGMGQLAPDETVATAEVVCTEYHSGNDATAQMVSDVAPYDQTQVRYKLKGGVPGLAYLLSVRITTSYNQKLSETMYLSVTK